MNPSSSARQSNTVVGAVGLVLSVAQLSSNRQRD